ncbi:UDP-glucose 4-epimerase GalE [Thaumasiovibrio subtropicus]|uniref:UDP-glucose 4-epimerase GalE n=1 Tax=Thaumasiovibrio subtropicus TaxID=1891207 RepID=UPI000B354984|nr:UDP-glucose 4-epimerase GalE [Thaumasiovibrio subtropicus]
MKVLVTGGLGYIGSHTCVQLICEGITPIILDNLSNCKIGVLDRIESLSGERPEFYLGDIRDAKQLDEIFSAHNISAVIHFAGLKSVAESSIDPVAYYENNVAGSITLLHAMDKAGIHNLVFSSSATVYGDPYELPITESASVGNTTNPYGRSKFMVECLLSDYASAKPKTSITLLRYFNPVGAHPSGLLGEDPNGLPNNLMPFIAQVAVGRREKLSIYGDDYSTTDGTGVRDYIHVMDLAAGHLAALKQASGNRGLHTYNLGTGKGTSVLELVKAFGKACGQSIPFEICDRRKGDIAACWASTTKAEKALSWKAKRSIEDMCVDAWNWQFKNPKGY